MDLHVVSGGIGKQIAFTSILNKLKEKVCIASAFPKIFEDISFIEEVYPFPSLENPVNRITYNSFKNIKHVAPYFNNFLKVALSDHKKLLMNVIQSVINFKSLEKQMSFFDGLSPINVLTKLDEIIVNSYDFSIYHDLNCKLGLLSGTNNIIDSIAFANSLILAQYMKEN